MPTPPDLRVAKPSDIPALQALIGQSARELSRGFYTDGEIESVVRHVFGVDTALVADGTYLMAVVDGELAGCGGWSWRRTMYGGDQRPMESGSRLDPKTDPARIRAFFVAPRMARRGVGKLIYTACADAAAAAGFGSLELMSTLPGVPFYSALGFSEVEQVDDLLPDGVSVRFVRMRHVI